MSPFKPHRAGKYFLIYYEPEYRNFIIHMIAGSSTTKFIYILLLSQMLILTGCSSQTDSGAKPISIEEVTRRLGSDSTPVILDVRSQEEFDGGHIPGAIHIPHDELASRLGEISVAKSEEIVVHCQSGGRAKIAEKNLFENGFTNIRDLEGHWKSWSASGLPVE